MNKETKSRVYVDFNSRDEHNDVILNFTRQREQDLQTVLKDGNRLVLFDETMEAEGLVKWNAEIKYWVATLDLGTIHHYDYTPKQRD
jgi:hypothetical protein